uniref:Pectate lyase/Amb allergen n=1 Tax=uncultured bacterium contig00195 TaxID=1181607 RepID=A0A806KIV0_9BACT|nr:pectate lyase/Amb allergen [uncultured bacterium contig00195]
MLNRFLFALLPVLAAAVSAMAQQPPYVLTAPFGYGRDATGGAGGTVITVTTREQFATAVAASGNAIILVSGTLTFGEGQMVKSVVANKTVIGLPGAKLVSTAQVKDGGIWQLSENSNNVIIRNLIFEGPGAYDVDGNDLLFNRGTNVWVDHCEFYDGVDGNFDNSNGADNVTITWNKFGYNKPAKAGGSGGSDDHRFSNLVSGGDGTAPADGRYSITFAYNWWGNGVRERMPRARNAQLHLLNNYVNSNVGSKAIGLSAGNNGSDVYVENCHFKAVNTVLDAGYGGSPKVTIVGSDRNNGNTNGGTSAPAYDYTAMPWESVEAAVTGSCGAGATLQVNESTGAVSCGSPVPSSSSAEMPSSSSEESTPILAQPPHVRALRATPLYYNLKGEPLGTAKPSNPGVYIEKNGKQVRKIVVR